MESTLERVWGGRVVPEDDARRAGGGSWIAIEGRCFLDFKPMAEAIELKLSPEDFRELRDAFS